MRTKAMGFKILCLLLTSFMVGGMGCGRKKTGRSVDAHILANTYTNSFFGFSLNIPSDWVVLNRAQIENLPPPAPLKQFRNPVDSRLITIPDVELYNLITLVEHTNLFSDVKTTAMASTNLTLSVMAQDMSWNNEVLTGKDYLEMIYSMFGILAGSGQRVPNAGPVEVDVGGRKFYRDTFQRTYKGVSFHDRIYARMESNQALVFVLSAPTKGDLDKLEQILATVTFH